MQLKKIKSLLLQLKMKVGTVSRFLRASERTLFIINFRQVATIIAHSG